MDAVNVRGGWGGSGQGNPHHGDTGEIRAHLREAVDAACAQIGVASSGCVSLFAGVAGVTDETEREVMREHLAAIGLARAQLGVDHDIRIALAGGLGGTPGMALIVGTGSSCYGRATDGRAWQTGGWGSLIADEGSGYFLGREAIAAAARMADGRAAETALRAAVFSWLEIEDISALLHRLHQTERGRTEIAALAPRVVGLAAAGDAPSREILGRGAHLLAEMVAANHALLPTAPAPAIIITGGLGTADTIYREMIVGAIRTRLPAVKVQEPLLPPAIGAALLAMEQVGRKASAALIEELRRFAR